MVQFGQTLNEVVKRDWAPHAVPYALLKQALRTSSDPNSDANSVHTESSYTISEEQKAKFATIYDDAVRRLVEFYEEKEKWAKEKEGELEVEVGGCLRGAAQGEGGDISGLIDQCTNFSKDLGLVLEFLELNAMAFSKIMKKFDKRTGSALREIKIQELKTNYQFLYDGGTLKRIKNTTEEWIKQLYFLFAKLRAKKGSASLLAPLDVLNPQESLSDTGSAKSVKWDDKVTGGSVGNESIHETKESKFITKSIEKVNEELLIQKTRSPFFDTNHPRNPPPSFVSSEIKLDKILGTGEYCKIHEVVQFDVPESCHICFLHRGFQDTAPSESSTLSSSTPSKKAKAKEDKTHMKSNKSSLSPLQPSPERRPSPPDKSALLSSPERRPSPPGHRRGVSWEQVPIVIPTHPSESSRALASAERETIDRLPKKTHEGGAISFFSFQHDDNISDYDDLEEDHEDEYDHETRGFMKDHCLRSGEARYAVKRIRSDLKGEDAIDASIDLAREAQFLAGLSHPSIIKIRGTCGVAGHPKFSIVLDRLYETLETKMLIWKEEVKKSQGFMNMFGKDKKALKKNWINRLLSAYDIAHAMNYLHGRGILHRDLKPANIGFDVRGDIKIFDLGLAKELKPCQQVGIDQYHTSGIAGTRRYMAPEVAQVIPYGFSADVYSYGILVWEMMTLKPAFHNFTRGKHFKEVIVEGKRPKIPRSWPYVERNLLERCWAPKPPDRPTFQAVCQLIKFGLPDETFDSSRSVDLMMRSLRSTGAHLESGLVREDMLSGTIRTRCDTGDTLMSANAKESKL